MGWRATPQPPPPSLCPGYPGLALLASAHAPPTLTLPRPPQSMPSPMPHPPDLAPPTPTPVLPHPPCGSPCSGCSLPAGIPETQEVSEVCTTPGCVMAGKPGPLAVHSLPKGWGLPADTDTGPAQGPGEQLQDRALRAGWAGFAVEWGELVFCWHLAPAGPPVPSLQQPGPAATAIPPEEPQRLLSTFIERKVQ